MMASWRNLLILTVLWLFTTGGHHVVLSLSTSSSPLPTAHAAVIVPGFLTGQTDFQPLAKSLTSRGIPTVVINMPAWHWIPCLNGRSIRPVLERLDYTVRHVCSSLDEETGDINVPPFGYSIVDCVQDFFENPGGIQKVGGSDVVDEYPTSVTPRGRFPPPASPPKVRIALIGHSAGGFISRAYLSERPYGGKSYRGIDFVHSLVTLGTPHANAPGPVFENVKWVNQELLPIRGLAVGSSGSPGNSSGALTQGAYAFCTGNESDGSELDGDGLTTVESSLALQGDRVKKLLLDGVTHYPWSDAGIWGDLIAPELSKEHRAGKPWYGDEPIIDEWADFLRKHSEADKPLGFLERLQQSMRPRPK